MERTKITPGKLFHLSDGTPYMRVVSVTESTVYCELTGFALEFFPEIRGYSFPNTVEAQQAILNVFPMEEHKEGAGCGSDQAIL